MTIKFAVLEYLSTASTPLDASTIAAALHMTRSKVAHALVPLYRAGLLSRNMERSGITHPYCYLITPAGRVEVEGRKDAQLPGDRAVDAAIKRMKGKWRKGERFSEDEKRAYREEQERRGYFGIQRY